MNIFQLWHRGRSIFYVYRGVAGGTLPSSFWHKNQWNVAGGVEIRFLLKGLIDVEEELARLRKEIARVEDDMAFVNKKLGNPKFVERAPEHIVQKERDKLAGFEQEKSALESSMSDLENLR